MITIWESGLNIGLFLLTIKNFMLRKTGRLLTIPRTQGKCLWYSPSSKGPSIYDVTILKGRRNAKVILENLSVWKIGELRGGRDNYFLICPIFVSPAWYCFVSIHKIQQFPLTYFEFVDFFLAKIKLISTYHGWNFITIIWMPHT